MGRAEDGRPIFVRGAVLPGEEVTVTITRNKKDFLEGDLDEVRKRSTERIEARCPHFGPCGGCTFQHVAYQHQLTIKENFVRESLIRIAKLATPPILPIIPSPQPWGYRNKMEYTFFTKDDGGIGLGLHERGSYERLINVEKCPIFFDQIGELLTAIRVFADASGLPSYDYQTHEGFFRNLVIRRSIHTGELMVNLVTAEGGFDREAFLLGVAPFKPTTVLRTVNRQRSQAVKVDAEEILAGSGSISETIHGLSFTISPAAFFQTNTLQAETMVTTVRDWIGKKSVDLLLDLYSGIGMFSLALADKAGKVIGLEINSEAVDDAEENAHRNHITNADFFALPVEALSKGTMHLPQIPHVILLDPPRAGLSQSVVEWVCELASSEKEFKKLMYVSCNPATLARDLAILTSVFSIAKIQPLDLFPQTYHVETIVELVYDQQ